MRYSPRLSFSNSYNQTNIYYGVEEEIPEHLVVGADDLEFGIRYK